ncbi:MAG: hypothetical protein IPP55_02660 [Anaerolineales bacterium]|nr:hypothetical protein [Anaerolineales bacterium]
MGGGLTRSLGLVFLLLAIASILRLYKTQEKKYLPFAILFSSLTVLSHPEAAVHTAGISLIFFLFHGRSKLGWKHTLLIAAGTLLLTSMWWLPILLRFGLTLPDSQPNGLSLRCCLVPSLLPSTNRRTTNDPYRRAGTHRLGFFHRKETVPAPILYILPYLTEPRSAPVYATIALAMLTGFILVELILPRYPINLSSKTDPPRLCLYILSCIFSEALHFSMFNLQATLFPKRIAPPSTGSTPTCPPIAASLCSPAKPTPL